MLITRIAITAAMIAIIATIDPMISESLPLPEGVRTGTNDLVGSSTKVVSGVDRLLAGAMKLLDEIDVNVGGGVWLEVGFSEIACEGLTLVVAMDSVGCHLPQYRYRRTSACPL
jgi:hypothetical protein